MQAPTVWRLESGFLIETRGRRERRVDLSTVRRLHLTQARGRLGAGAILGLPRGQMGIFSGPAVSLKARPDSPTYAPFIRALAASLAEIRPSARFTVPALATQGTVIGVAVLLGVGALMLALFALVAGQLDIGLALAARLGFVAILALAVLPWLDRQTGLFDPRNIPAGLLGSVSPTR